MNLLEQTVLLKGLMENIGVGDRSQVTRPQLESLVHSLVFITNPNTVQIKSAITFAVLEVLDNSDIKVLPSALKVEISNQLELTHYTLVADTFNHWQMYGIEDDAEVESVNYVLANYFTEGD